MTPLKELPFSDLILGDQGFYIKGAPDSPILKKSPQEYHPILSTLFSELSQHKEKEFLHVFEGVQYRVAKMNTVKGSWYALRKGLEFVPDFKMLGMPSAVGNILLSNKLRHGLIVFSGEMGSGKTTSASAHVVELLRCFGGHAVTLEDPPELLLQGEHGNGYCFQHEVKNGQFGPAIVDAMRYAAPRIIFLGELRESHGVSEALRAAINGHIIIATIHASSIIATIRRLYTLSKPIDGDASPGLLADGMYCVVNQNLSAPDPKRENKKRLKVKILYAGGPTSSIRNKIQELKFNQLSTEIQSQQNQLFLKGGVEK